VLSNLSRFLAFAAISVLFQAAVVAQTQRGQIVGRITDSTGAVVSGDKVEVTNSATGVKMQTGTNTKGLYTIPYLHAGAAPAAQTTAIRIDPADVTKLMWDRAEAHGFPPLAKPPGSEGPPWGTENWTSREQYLAWDVEVPRAGQYLVSVLYLCKPGSADSEYEIAAGPSKLSSMVRETGNAWRKPGWDRPELPGTLRLPARRTKITLRITKPAPGAANLIDFRALELILPSVKKAMEERAAKQRPDMAWFVAAKYGLKFFWTASTQPRRGPAKPFCEAVRDFDVKRFADMVEETGAGYVLLSGTRAKFWFPGPIPEIEKILPGRTCERDLIGEIADELNRRGIRLMIHLGWPAMDPDYVRVTHYVDADKTIWARHFCSIVSGIGRRYGVRLSGTYLACQFETYLYPYKVPWEAMTIAARTGNPNRLVTFNHWIFPKLTEFQDYWVGESNGLLLHPPEPGVFRTGPQAGMQPHMLQYLDDSWEHLKPDTAIKAPLHTTEELINHVNLLIENRTVATLNVSIYQDGTISPATMEQLRALRAAIRGK